MLNFLIASVEQAWLHLNYMVIVLPSKKIGFSYNGNYRHLIVCIAIVPIIMYA